MTRPYAYYNEFDPFAAAWLRELIAAGHIADGYVDERSIEDVRPSELAGFTQCHFFAGIGGWSYALRLAGFPDSEPVWTGSCPCQPFSTAGKGGGFADERHLWPAFFHLITQCQPAIVFGEQVAGKPGLAWFELVSTDLEGRGYAVGAANLGAHSVGFNHARQRLFWVAKDANSDPIRLQRQRPAAIRSVPEFTGLVQSALSGQTATGPYNLRDDGVPTHVGQLRGYGNAIVPQVAAAFIQAALAAAP